MSIGSSHIIRGNALDLPLAEGSVDLICTSPPYFALRSYTDGGSHYDGQIGSEATPAEFVDALLAATREMVRVVKPSGSIWVNLGDKYAQDQERSRNGNGNRKKSDTPHFGRADMLGGRGKTMTLGRKDNGVPRKSLIGIPWRYALRCIDDLGLILRAEVIWSKPNGLPESVTDRVRRSHEQWFHFVRQPRYFSAVDEIREQAEARNGAMTWAERKAAGEPARRGEQGANDATRNGMTPNPLGKLPGSVWTIPTQPLTVPPELGVDHFAAFPMEWPRRIIQGWSPAGVCTACGEGRRPTTSKATIVRAPGDAYAIGRQDRRVKEQQNRGTRPNLLSEHTITGYACACPDITAPTTPAVVLDPFGGTGTTALVAKSLGRHGISVDMSADYCRLAQWRTSDPGELARAMQVEKPAKQIEGQISMLDLLEEGGAA